MRIGLLIYGSLDTVSGGYLYDRKLVEHLRAQGDQVEIISLPWRNYFQHIGDNFSPALLARLEQLKLDVLLQDELNHPSLFWLNGRLRRSKTYPIIAIVHHLRCSEKRPAWQNNIYGWVERQYLNTLDGFIFNSQTTRQVVGQQGINLQALPHVVATPAADHIDPHINIKEITTRAAVQGPLRLLFVGNLIPRKGLHTLLAALARLPKGSWQLTVIGSPDVDAAYTRAIRQQIETAHIAGSVDLAGSVGQNELSAYLKNSHVLAVPSSYEGFGIVYLEGMGFGLPAIASSDGGAGEIITHRQNGCLVPAGDVGALSRCLAELANDRQLLLSLSLAARQRYLAQPTWKHSAKKIRAFLASI